MPELPEEMYCSEQIAIPPTFPYLLRQFAKAAIRSQPNDLLKWACAYFRCLSLNIPPPIKVRLEYPIPNDYKGVTPGWLKALLNQFAGAQTVPFQLLWERWTGACLEHNALIQILCLGNFQNNLAIPIYRFIALCCGFLRENLTHTMILICEVLTEEPEGGSAMILKQIFLDLYVFLANIDASNGQMLHNYFFRDDVLNLIEKKMKKAAQAQIKAIEEVESVSTETVEEEQIVEKKVMKQLDDGTVISCPSVESFTPTTPMDYVASTPRAKERLKKHKEDELLGEGGGELSAYAVSDYEMETEAAEEEVQYPPFYEEMSLENIHEAEGFREEDIDAKILKEDLQRLKALQAEPGEGSDLELEKFKATLIVEEKPKVEEEVEEEAAPEEEQLLCDYDEVWVDAVPGIGSIVPKHIIEAVIKYIDEVAECQHGMVGPRNITHYNCPPLEVIE